MMKKHFFLIACLLLFGCKRASNKVSIAEFNQEDNFGQKININNIDKTAVLRYSEVFDNVSFIKLETQANSLIGRIDKIIVTGNKFIILDISGANAIFVFDDKGKFLNRIGTKGSGPEEYDFPDDIAYDKYNDELLIWSRNQKKIMRFKLDGTFIKNIVTDYWASSIFVMAKDTYLLYLNNIHQRNRVPNDFNIIIVNENGEKLKELLPIDKNKIQLSPPSLNDFSIYQDEILFSPQYSSKVFKIEQGKVEPKYYLDFDKNSIPPSLSNNITFRNFTKAINEYGYAFNIAMVETASHIIIQFVYKKMIYDCFYSKISGITKIAATHFNDMYGLASSKTLLCIKGDFLISCVQPHSFVLFQDMIKNGEKDINKILLDQINSIPMSAFSNNLKKNYSQAIESSQIILNDTEIDFINSIKEDDNPIIMIAKLKEF
jgi:hypothetical protein